MKIERVAKPSFAVIGIEGSTRDGDGFVQHLWADANSRFGEVAHLARRNEDGSLEGIWGAMSDFSLSFKPWEENFSQGLYLAGVECCDEAQPPEGWTKWVIPGYEYIRAECENDDTFSQMLDYIAENDVRLVAAVHDFTCPNTGKNYMYFPVREL